MYFIVGGVILASTFFYYIYTSFMASNFLVKDGDRAAYVEITDSTGFHELANELYDRKILQHPESFAFVAKVLDYQDHMKPGVFRIEPGATNVEAIKVFTGEPRPDVEVTFLPTQSSEELSRQICKNLEVEDTAFYRVITDTAYLASAKWTPATIWATFIPNTYRVFKDASAEEVLERMIFEGNQYWSVKKANRADSMGVSRMDVMILASIIYQESKEETEYERIAGVYLNRLRDSIALEADPTIEFAHQRFDFEHISDSLLMIDSPYNTYKVVGLPPSPICIPSIAAMEAVLNAEDHDYYYMCAIGDCSGKHYFAKTLNQHNVNKAMYKKRLAEGCE